MTLRELVEQIGGHPASRLGIDLETKAGLESWLWLAALASGRSGEPAAVHALRALESAGLLAPGALAEVPLGTLADALASARIAQADVAAIRLQALASAVRELDLARLPAEADHLDALGARLARLAPGFGPTAVARFLRPLRDRFAVIDELPLAREAVAAAEHLGWLGDDADPQFAAGSLRALLREDAEAPALLDVEAALERLGRASCARRNPKRCPLAERCPVLDSESVSGVASVEASD